MNKVIARIVGGLGNQLFCYSAARRLAIANDAELVIDNVTGFKRDWQYRRIYMLDHFNIKSRKATPAEYLEPFERYRRGLLRWMSAGKPYSERKYLAQEGNNFDSRLLERKVNGTLYLEGYWQSELYFKDSEQIIRKDLYMIPPSDQANLRMAAEISESHSIGLHIRWFDAPGNDGVQNASIDYFKRAVKYFNDRIEKPRYFIFSDSPDAAKDKLGFVGDSFVYVSHNKEAKMAYADLWLMSQCHHFITANSTFSWWGAWLGTRIDKIVLTPDLMVNAKTSWGFDGLIPEGWIKF